MRILSTLLIMALFFALGVFIVQNTHRVPLTYFWGEWEAPMWAVVLETFMLGLVFALVAQVLERIGAGRKTRRLEKKLRELEQELERMRGGGGA
jgi:uncharacterized integral membrane protein